MGNTKQLGLASAVFALLSTLALHRGQAEAAEAVRRYGFNVDSGMWEIVAALYYLGPLAMLCGLCAIASWRGWKIEHLLRRGTVGLLVAPWLALALMVFVTGLVNGIRRML
jgi:hypothetical protein